MYGVGTEEMMVEGSRHGREIRDVLMIPEVR